MNRSSLPVSLNTLRKWYTAETPSLRDDLPFQRHSGMWNNITQSSLVWSLLVDAYIPAIVLLKDKVRVDEKGKDVFEFQILDGKQRLTSLFSFINGEYKLHSATPEVEVDGVVYDLAGLSFDELSAECQDAIKNYRFSVQCLENYTMQEAESLFYNINSGVALSPVQKAKARLGSDLIILFNGLLMGNFFTQAINITERQARSEDDLLMLLQICLLLDNKFDGRPYKNISAATCLEYAAEIRNTYTSMKCDTISDLAGYLNEGFTTKLRFLKKTSVPIVGVCAQIAKEQGIAPKDFKAFIDSFANEIHPVHDEYLKYSGSGNIKAYKVQMRLRLMFLSMCRYFGWEPEKISPPFSKDIPLYADEQSAVDAVETSSDGSGEPVSAGVVPDESNSSAENAEVTADTPSVDNASEDGAENTNAEG